MSFLSSESISRWWILVERSFCNHEEGGEDDEDDEDDEDGEDGEEYNFLTTKVSRKMRIIVTSG